MAIYGSYACVRTSPYSSTAWVDDDGAQSNVPVDINYVTWDYLDDGSPVYTDYEPKTYFGTTNPPDLVHTGDVGYASDQYDLPADLESGTTYYLRGWTQEQGYTDTQTINSAKNYLDFSGANFATIRRLVTVGNNTIYYEAI